MLYASTPSCRTSACSLETWRENSTKWARSLRPIWNGKRSSTMRCGAPPGSGKCSRYGSIVFLVSLLAASLRSRRAGRVLGARRASLTWAYDREVVLNDAIKVFRLYLHGQIVIGAVVMHLKQQIARVAAAHPTTNRAVVFGQQVLHGAGVELAADQRRAQREQVAELVFERIIHVNLVRNAAQEGFIHQFMRLDVGREDDELVERHLDFFAGGQRQEIIALFQRDNPAIEQFERVHPLPAEIVDQQRAAVALHLQRRFADVRMRVVTDLQTVHGQLA